MLRLIFVFGIILVGVVFSLQGAFYALLFYLWNAYFRPEQWVYGGSVLALNLSFVIGAYLVLRTALSLPKPQINLRTALLFLFLVLCVVGALTSEHSEWSWSFLGDFWKVLLISYFVVILADDRKKFRTTLLVIGLSLGFECAKQGWANLYIAPGATNNNTIPFLGDNNGVALGAMMLVPVLGALAQTAATRWEKYALRFVAVGVFMRGFTTYSRGGFLAAGVVGLFTFVRSEKKIRALIGVAAICVLVLSVMPQDFWNRMQTIAAPEEDRMNASEGRLHFWEIAVDMANAKPLTGVGLNGFEPSYESYNAGQDFGGERATHSTWFGILADLGYPGLLIFLANFGMAVWSCWRVNRMARRDPAKRELRVYADALLTSLAAFAVAGTFLSEQYNEMLWHFIGLSTTLYLVTMSEHASPKAVVAAPAQPLRPTPRVRTRDHDAAAAM